MNRHRSWPTDPEQARATLCAELGPAWCVSYANNSGRFRAVRGRATGCSSVEAADPAALFAAVEAYFDDDDPAQCAPCGSCSCPAPS